MYIAEYNQRKALFNIGIVSNYDNISPEEANIFTIVGNEFDKMDEEAREARNNASKQR